MATRYDWMQVGEKEVAEESRPAFLEAIKHMEWETDRESKMPMSQGMAINEAIRQLRIPKVSAVSFHGGFWGDHGFTYGILGIEGYYKNDTRVRLYVVDDGTGITPIMAEVNQKAIA